MCRPTIDEPVVAALTTITIDEPVVAALTTITLVYTSVIRIGMCLCTQMVNAATHCKARAVMKAAVLRV